MNYLYYPGCSLEFSSKPYDESTRAVAKTLGIGLRELDDWNCCGSTAYMSVEELLSFAIASRNLAIAEKQGEKEIVAVCPACYTTLNKINEYLGDKADLKKKINEALGAAKMKYEGTVKTRHFLDIIVNDVGLPKVREKVTRPLKGLRVAPYYGCMLSRPHGMFDDKEMPVTLDNLIESLGATAVHFPLKAKCCGGMIMSTAEDVALKLNRELLYVAAKNGADCIATTCPLCQMNLEAYQDKINSKFGTDFAMPILFFTQLMGVAFGISHKELGITKAILNPQKALAKV